MIPTFGDLDNDGDKDLIVGDFNGRIFYYKNSGNIKSPRFDIPIQNPFGYQRPASNAVFLAPVLEDANKDGLLDLWVGYNPGFIRLFNNLGTPTSPLFGPSEGNPLGLSLSSFNIWAMPIFADIDGDGDRDMFITSFPNVFFYENVSSAVTSLNDLDMESVVALSIEPNPADDFCKIVFNLSKNQEILINILSPLGQMICAIKVDRLSSGRNELVIPLINLNEGIYFIRMQIEQTNIFRSFVVQLLQI